MWFNHIMIVCSSMALCIFSSDTASTEIYTLSLHDALPIWWRPAAPVNEPFSWPKSSDSINSAGTAAQFSVINEFSRLDDFSDRKSTRLNSSHLGISYAVFCLKKKKTIGTRVDRYLRHPGDT